MNLTINARGFAPPEFETQGEIVPLAESADTLELLFQFCYPSPYPFLGGVEFDVLALLAEAAEKYQVFSAMNICKIYMKWVIRFTLSSPAPEPLQEVTAEPCGRCHDICI